MVTWSGKLELTSPAFSDGGEIPRECGYKNGNHAPPLDASVIPQGTKSLALIMDDPDAMGAVGKVWVHWVLWDIMASDGPLGTGRVCKRGMTDFGKLGYGGPAPPDKMHTYVFKLYTLDSILEYPPKGDRSTKADVEKAMEGHIIEQAKLTGTYAP